MTGREALNWAARLLVNAGRDDCAGMARRMLEDALGISAAELIGAMEEPVDDARLHAFRAMADRAAGGEPLQYVLGRWDFYGRAFRCDGRALIPRPETELLVEAALAAMPAGEALSVLDAGCGTGCIGLTVKLERPAASVALCDISQDALALARENAGLLRADVSMLCADMREPLPGGPYDVIVSNPPYVSEREMGLLPREIRGFEPELALLGGRDGMDFLRALVDRAGDGLKPGGRLFMEVGCGQAGEAVRLLKNAGMAARALPDYAGIPRVVAAGKAV
jgi:release factor glutamine methyltransferase